MAKQRLTSLRSLVTLFTQARSTEWPGPSRYAMYIPLLCLVVAVAQLGVDVTLGSKLLHVGDQVACREGGRVRMTSLPVTYTLINGGGTEKRAKMSMRENSSKALILFTAILTPLLIVITLLSLFLLHLRRLSNRTAITVAFCLLSGFMLTNAQDTLLRIDSRHVHNDYPLCFRSGPEMDALWEAHHTRWQLLVAGEVLSGLGSLLTVFYLVLAFTAASLNRAIPQAPPNTPLQTLTSADSLAEPAFLLPPPQLHLRPLSPMPSLHFAESNESEAEPKELPTPYTTKIAEAEKRIREYREGAAGSTNPFADPETGKWRKDSSSRGFWRGGLCVLCGSSKVGWMEEGTVV